LTGVHRLAQDGEGFIERVGHHVAVAGFYALADARRVYFNAQKSGAVHSGSQGLGSAHAAKSAGDHQASGQRSAEVLAGGGGERLVSALQDALRADVDPTAGGHLAIHDEPELFERAELLPIGPVADQVGIGDQDPGGLFVGAEDAHGTAGLHEQGFIGGERFEFAHDGMERGPIAGGLAGAAVDHQVRRALGDVRVEVVHEHAQGGFLFPPPAAQGRAARGADDWGHASIVARGGR
jgi:hypothetical protein